MDPKTDHGEFAHGPDEGIPPEEWMPVPVSDSADYLDRPDPQYLNEEE